MAKWADRNNLEINIEKTVQMTFKKGGKLAQGDTLYISGNKFKVLNKFRYLGVTLQQTMNLFAYHIQERSTAAIKTIYGMKNLRQLSTTTAIALFQNVITQIVTY